MLQKSPAPGSTMRKAQLFTSSLPGAAGDLRKFSMCRLALLRTTNRRLTLLQVAKEVKKLIHEGLDTAKSEDEQTLFIQFVRNSELPEFIPKILHFAENSEHPLVHHLAITTLGAFNRQDFPNDVLIVMSRIYHQNKRQYESTVRSAAASLILTSNPSERDVQNILLSLPQLKSKELANFILARIMELIKMNHDSK